MTPEELSMMLDILYKSEQLKRENKELRDMLTNNLQHHGEFQNLVNGKIDILQSRLSMLEASQNQQIKEQEKSKQDAENRYENQKRVIYYQSIVYGICLEIEKHRPSLSPIYIGTHKTQGEELTQHIKDILEDLREVRRRNDILFHKLKYGKDEIK